jgi:hypothetical protein
VLACLDNEIEADLFGRELLVEVPIARLQACLPSAELALPIAVVWQPVPPGDDSAEHRLFERLGAHGLLLEPFERAALALREVFSPSGSKLA